MFGKLKEKLASEAVQKSMGLITDLAKKHLGPKFHEFAEDEEKMKAAFGKLYGHLPGAVATVCSQETFVNLCWEHKDKLIKKEAA